MLNGAGSVSGALAILIAVEESSRRHENSEKRSTAPGSIGKTGPAGTTWVVGWPFSAEKPHLPPSLIGLIRLLGPIRLIRRGGHRVRYSGAVPGVRS